MDLSPFSFFFVPLTVTIAADEISERDGTTTVTVTRSNQDDDQPLTVDITTSGAGGVSVPATIVIPAGEPSATFTLTAVDDNLLDGTQIIGITAAAAGYVGGSDTLLVTDYETLGLSLSGAEISERSGTAVATVSRSNTDDLTQPLTVTLTGSDASEATVPAAVVIPVGATSATFSVAAADDTLLDGTQSVTLSASAAGYLGAQSLLQVTDYETLTIEITATAMSEWGGSASATVRRSNTDRSQPLVVSLAASDPGQASVPATVTIPALQASVTFDVTAVDDNLLDGTQTVTVTGSSAGYVSVTDRLDVTDHETLMVTIADAAVSERGGSTTATVYRTDTDDLSQALNVTLTNGDASEVTLPASVTIPAAASSVTFPVTAVDDNLLDGTQSVTVTATAAGFIGGSGSLSVTDHETLTLAIADDAVSEFGGSTSAMIRRSSTDDLSQPLEVRLANSDATEAAVPTTVVIPAGEASATFTIAAVDDRLLDGQQQTTITASANGYEGSSETLNVTDFETISVTILPETRWSTERRPWT